MAPLAVPLMLAGTAVSAYGQYKQAAGYESMGDAAAQQGLMEQQILDQNAKIEERVGQAKLVRAQEEARQLGKEGEALKGRASVLQAKSGTTGPTNFAVLEDMSNEIETDRMILLRNGYLEKWFALSSSENMKYQGRVDVVRGLNEQQGYEYQAKGAKLAAVGTLLTGSGSVYGMNSMKSTNKDSYLKWKYGV